MTAMGEQLPRIFQANLARLYERVIQPAIDGLVLHPVLERGEASSMDEFLDRAAAQVDNYTANEAAKSFVLTLAAVFERQLSIWARAMGLIDVAKLRGFQEQLLACAELASVDLAIDDLGAELIEMFTVANVVRHGDYIDLLPGPRLPSESLRIRSNDLVRYIMATTRFWGRADPLPMAVTDPPYWPS